MADGFGVLPLCSAGVSLLMAGGCGVLPLCSAGVSLLPGRAAPSLLLTEGGQSPRLPRVHRPGFSPTHQHGDCFQEFYLIICCDIV